MPTGLGASLGLGGGRSATSSGGSGVITLGFRITIRDTRANIEARSSPDTGTIAFVTSGVNEFDLMVYDSTNWQIYENS